VSPTCRGSHVYEAPPAAQHVGSAVGASAASHGRRNRKLADAPSSSTHHGSPDDVVGQRVACLRMTVVKVSTEPLAGELERQYLPADQLTVIGGLGTQGLPEALQNQTVRSVGQNKQSDGGSRETSARVAEVRLEVGQLPRTTAPSAVNVIHEHQMVRSKEVRRTDDQGARSPLTRMTSLLPAVRERRSATRRRRSDDWRQPPLCQRERVSHRRGHPPA